MISGIGLDIIELSRIERLVQRSPKFYKRILTPNEQLYYEQAIPSRQLEFLAARFAAKEAFAKAKGTGIGAHCSFQDIEVSKAPSGAPSLLFQNVAVQGFISITHTRDYAAAQVILLS
ncbi:holo-ACP synthase [Chryseomicrobium sp. FSL W7-1435]|uniref:holo-ACP synthase n=1 Tax=Chryseomicrobium sp. FSL W7-1435 TaxID=2921704 RepID=UPI003159C012